MGAEQTSLAAAREALVSHLPCWWASQSQADRALGLVDRAVRFAAGHGVLTLVDFDPALARAFIDAATTNGAPPSSDLRHRRRVALRLLFRAARLEGLGSSDPTADLVLPSRTPLRSRPLRDDEVALCRASAAWSLSDSRRAAAFALAEATGRTAELAQVRPDDVDVPGGRVWLHGGGTTRPRWGTLTDWGAAQVQRRLTTAGSDRGLLYNGDDPAGAGQISVSIALGDVLTRAGLGSEPDVRPGSIAAWAGRAILEETGRIDTVARRLGVSSLDRAARIIGWDWTDPEP